MKEFYHKLNNEKDTQRRLDWQPHRIEIHRMIDHIISTGSSREQVIIFGAGNCDDLELEYLSEQFDTVCLADIDYPSMMDALRRVDPPFLSRFQLVPADFSGLDQLDFYTKLQNLLDSKAEEVEITALLRNSENALGMLEVLPHFK
jgi:hypothetical protein